MSVIDLFSLLRELDGNLRKSEQKILDIILKDPSSISLMKGEKLAGIAGVSLPTVSRFCKQAGCNDFREFKLRLAQSVAIGEYYSNNTAISSRYSDLQTMSEGVINFAVSSMQNTLTKLNFRDLEMAIDMLARANRIYILGSGGASSILSDIMDNRLFRLGFPVKVFHEEILGKMAAATLSAGDLAIAISATGSSSSTIEFVKIAGSNNAMTLSITRRDSVLSHETQVSLDCDANEDGLVLKPATARYSYMVLVDILAFGLAIKNKDRSLELLKKQQSVVVKHKGEYAKDFLGD